MASPKTIALKNKRADWSKVDREELERQRKITAATRVRRWKAQHGLKPPPAHIARAIREAGE